MSIELVGLNNSFAVLNPSSATNNTANNAPNSEQNSSNVSICSLNNVNPILQSTYGPGSNNAIGSGANSGLKE